VRSMKYCLAVLAALLTACSSSDEQKSRLVETGNKYFETGKYKEASIIYRKAIQKDPRYGEAYYRLGLNELKLGRFADALRWLRRASELQPANDDAHSKLGDLYLSVYLSDRKKYKTLLGEFGDLADRMLKRDPKSFEGLRMKGFQLVAEEKLTEAIAKFEQADAVKPNDERLNLALAQSLAATGQREAGMARANQYIEKNKSFGSMYDFLYLQHLANRDLPSAEKVLSTKAANNPKQAIYMIELAAHYSKTGKPDQARATLDKIINNKKDFPDGRLTVGDFYYRMGDFAQAQREFQAAVKDGAANKITYEKRIVEMLAIQGKRAEAVEMADRLVTENKDDSEAQAIRASLKMRGGTKAELDDSIKELQSVISRMPDNAVVRYNLGDALAARGELEQAKLQFAEAIKLRPNYLQPRASLARIHLSTGEYPRTVQLADEILALSPSDRPAQLMRATALMGTNELAAARAGLGTVLQAEPNNRDAIYLLANLNYAEKKFADAETGFRQLYTMTPSDIRGLYGIAEMAMVNNHPDQARALLEKELATTKDKQGINLALANVFVRTQDYPNAIRIYEPMIAESPDNADLNMRLGEVFLRAQKLDDSRKYFEKAKTLAPKNVIPLLKLGTIYEMTGQRDRLIPTYEAVLKIQPDNGLALNNVAYHLAETGGDLDQALTYAQRAKQQLPTNNDVADTLGWIYIKKNLSDDAIKIFRDLLTKDSKRVEWRYHLAMALFQKGDKLEARKEANDALKNSPNTQLEKDIRALLQRIG
jgi:tetratricopeptide (TPR) repeat protein